MARSGLYIFCYRYIYLCQYYIYLYIYNYLDTNLNVTSSLTGTAFTKIGLALGVSQFLHTLFLKSYRASSNATIGLFNFLFTSLCSSQVHLKKPTSSSKSKFTCPIFF